MRTLGHTMKHLTVFSALVFACVPCACTTPPAASAGLAGTVWTGPAADGGTMHCEFQSGGTMLLSQAPGTWQQTGSAVTMNVNNGYAIYTGEVSGSIMSGSARNAAGKSWTWSVTRQ
jgi:hypothetical protein